MPILRLIDSEPPRTEAVYFVDCVTVGRDRSSHWVTGPAQTRNRHFAIVRSHDGYGIYDYDDTCGTYLLPAGGGAGIKVCGQCVRLEDRMIIRADLLSFEFVQTSGDVVPVFFGDPVRSIRKVEGWSWARIPEEIQDARRLGPVKQG
jgi:hypothetical protein